MLLPVVWTSFAKCGSVVENERERLCLLPRRSSSLSSLQFLLSLLLSLLLYFSLFLSKLGFTMNNRAPDVFCRFCKEAGKGHRSV